MPQEKLGHVAEIQMNQLPSVDGKRKKNPFGLKCFKKEMTKEPKNRHPIVP